MENLLIIDTYQLDPSRFSSIHRFRFMFWICLQIVGSLISTWSITSDPYVKLNGNFPMVLCGMHRYAHRTSKSSLAQVPLAFSILRFSSTTTTLLVVLA